MSPNNDYQIDIPTTFIPADQTEIERYFGKSEDVQRMFIDYDNHAMIICAVPKKVNEDYHLNKEIIGIKKAIKENIDQCNVLGLYKRDIEDSTLFLVQYTYKIGAMNMYSSSVFFVINRNYYNVNCVCRNNTYSKMEGRFMDVIDSIRV